jgi:hypothetical protein
MANLIDGMVQLNVPIPEELRDLIDSEIIKRCGYAKRGILGEIVTEALREYLYKRHAHTQTLAQDSQTRKKLEALHRLPNSSKQNAKYDILKSRIKRYGNDNDYKIHYSLLEDMIRQIFGNDKRTLAKYIELLENDVFIIPEDTGSYSTPKPIKQNVLV